MLSKDVLRENFLNKYAHMVERYSIAEDKLVHTFFIGLAIVWRLVFWNAFQCWSTSGPWFSIFTTPVLMQSLCYADCLNDLWLMFKKFFPFLLFNKCVLVAVLTFCSCLAVICLVKKLNLCSSCFLIKKSFGQNFGPELENIFKIKYMLLICEKTLNNNWK